MSQISAFNETGNALQSRTDNRFNSMTSEDFVKIIFAELSNQDPFSPNDSSALLEQLNSIRSIESDMQLVERLESLVLENQLGSAANFIGKHVTGLTDDNVRASGVAVSVIRQDDRVSVELDSGHLIPVTNVEAIVTPDAFPPPAPPLTA